MEQAGHECVGHVEIDKFARISYNAIHQPKEGEFDRAKEAGVSDSQLYKQAGNSVTVNVIYEIAKKLKEVFK